MKHLLYLSLLLAAAAVVIFGTSAMLEQQALRQRDVRIEQPAQAARAAGTPTSSKAPTRATTARTAMEDGL